VNTLKLDQVNSILKKYFQPDRLEIVVYGDGAAIETQLQKIGKYKRL
jgi:predicted Zn-dependent peptidase